MEHEQQETRYEQVAWRGVVDYRREESGSRIHIAADDSSKTLCGKKFTRGKGGAWANSPCSYFSCKRCRTLAEKRGVSRATQKTLPWAEVG